MGKGVTREVLCYDRLNNAQGFWEFTVSKSLKLHSLDELVMREMMIFFDHCFGSLLVYSQGHSISCSFIHLLLNGSCS